MALLNQSVQVAGQLPKIFETIRAGQAPEKMNRQFLKDIGFSSSNHLALVPLFKGLKFLSADGSPTQKYRELLDPTRWKHVLAEAILEAYSDIFVLKANPTKADRPMIMGKYKSTYNMSDNAAERAAATFLALLDLAGMPAIDEVRGRSGGQKQAEQPAEPSPEVPPSSSTVLPLARSRPDTSLHYNIQIHLPATKDIEVYNAIFRSLREHLID